MRKVDQPKALAQSLRHAADALQDAFGQDAAPRAAERVFECAYLNAWAAIAFRIGVLPPLDTGDFERQKLSHQTPTQAREWLDEGTHALAAALEAFPAAHLSESFSNPFTSQTPFSGQATTWQELAEFLQVNMLAHRQRLKEFSENSADDEPQERTKGDDKSEPEREQHGGAEHNRLESYLQALTERFSDLGGRLVEAAHALQGMGTPLSETLMAEMEEARREFDALRANVLSLARSVCLSPLPETDEIPSLASIPPLLRTIAEAEHHKRKAEKTRSEALAALDCVLSVTHRDDPDFVPLLQCQARAQALRLLLAEAHWAALPPEAEALAQGTDSFSDFLSLVENTGELDDASWAFLLQTVGQELGRELSFAAARGRFTLSDRHADPGERGMEELLSAESEPPGEAPKPKKPKASHFRFQRIFLP